MTGRLRPLWEKVGGRERLAELTGIHPTTLSKYNSGRQPLGEHNAAKLAAALDVSLAELGQPEDPSVAVDRLDALEARLEASEVERQRQERELAELRRQVDRLLRVRNLFDTPERDLEPAAGGGG